MTDYPCPRCGSETCLKDVPEGTALVLGGRALVGGSAARLCSRCGVIGFPTSSGQGRPCVLWLAPLSGAAA